MMYTPASPVGPRPGYVAPPECEYCQGPLGFDSKGLCAGCGAPMSHAETKRMRVAAKLASQRGYGHVLGSVPFIRQPDPERR